jgi:hypothetical protein
VTNEHDTLPDTLTELLELLNPVLAGGAAVARYNLGGTASSAKPFVGPLISTSDNLGVILAKLLQLIDGAVDSNGNFYVILGDASEPYVDPAPVKPLPAPQYHPPNERRYWARHLLDNPNPRP